MTWESGPPDFEPPDFGARDFGPPDFEPPRAQPLLQAPTALQFQPPRHPPLRGRPGRQAPVIILVALATVLVVLVAVDRVAPRLMGERVAVGLQSALGTDQRPVVRFGGFPFLTQVASRRYQQVSITARDIPVSGTDDRLEIDEFDGTLGDVRPDAAYQTISVGRFTGAATVGYPSLSDYVGSPISYDSSGTNGNGYVTMALGGAITMTGMPAIDAQSNQLYLVRAQFRIAGRLLPGAAPSNLTDQLFRFPLPELIDGVRLSNVRAGPNGLVFSAAGRNLRLRR